MDNTKIIITVLGILLVLSNGVQYTLNETGKQTTCSKGWEFISLPGNHEGQYVCKTLTPRYTYCSKVWNSSKITNYYCKEAVPVLIETNPEYSKNNAKEYICNANPKECK